MTLFHSSILAAQHSSSHPVLLFLSDLLFPTYMLLAFSNGFNNKAAGKTNGCCCAWRQILNHGCKYCRACSELIPLQITV